VTKLSPKGRGPVGRYAHTSSFISQYFIIHGGRNDHIYQTVKNIGLNDIHLYNISTNSWMALAIYDQIPNSRWGHVAWSDPVK